MTGFDIKGGVHCADFIGGDKNITYGFSAEDVERLIEKVLGLTQAGGVFISLQDRPDVLQIEHGNEKLVFRPGAARQLANQNQERAYLLALMIDREYQRWATLFVPLAGKMDVRQVIEGLPISFTEFVVPVDEAEAPPTQKPLQDIAEALQNHGAFVILGEPGAGKTTTMQKIALDAARDRLENRSEKIPLFVRLSQQGGQDPYSFLEAEWERRVEIPFKQALRAGQILILADGINEIPREKRNEHLKAWMVFEEQYLGMNQLVFSGRQKDYDNQLNLPRVVVEPLDEERVHEFLRKYKAEGLAELLDDPSTRLDEMARNPLNLFLLVMVYLRGGRNMQTLSNRGRLFQSFTQDLMRREQLWHPDALNVDAKVDMFARLAYEMQRQAAGTTFTSEAARNALPTQVTVMDEQVQVDPGAILRFGRGASILDPATVPDVRFYHHLLQEYFAARELLRRFNGGEDLSVFWKAPRTKQEMPPTNVGAWDPLPEPPTTGWEVTTLLACGLSSDPARLIEAVRQHNPALAGRCLYEAGVFPLPLGEGLGVREKVRSDLLTDLYNPDLHLRTRLQAGLVLGRVGDPRFEPQNINGIEVILPHMVPVPAGKYLIGSKDDEDANDYESPQFPVHLPAFSIGKWQVTNAEFGCFMKAGGYENESYWHGALAKGWLKGDDVTGGQLQVWLDEWKRLQENPNWKEEWAQSGEYPPSEIERYEHIAALSEDQYKQMLAAELSQKSRSQPDYWKDRQRNNPSQPVIGITWFEARAYCAWLSEVTGKQYRLPTEVEWEAAARAFPSPSGRGARGEGRGEAEGNPRKYPWGDDWDPDKANSVEGRVLRASPVGAYAAAGAVGPFGAEDQAGNVWDWTSSLFLPYPYDAEKSEAIDVEGERVVRGGSWADTSSSLRSTNRFRNAPGNFGNYMGFRLFSPGSDISR